MARQKSKNIEIKKLDIMVTKYIFNDTVLYWDSRYLALMFLDIITICAGTRPPPPCTSLNDFPL